MPLEYVRVKDKVTGDHYSVLQAEVDASPDAFQVLKQPAVNLNGDPLPLETPSTENSGQSAATKKETS